MHVPAQGHPLLNRAFRMRVLARVHTDLASAATKAALVVPHVLDQRDPASTGSTAITASVVALCFANPKGRAPSAGFATAATSDFACIPHDLGRPGLTFANRLCGCCTGSRGTALCNITRPSIRNRLCDCSGGCGRACCSGPRRSSFSFSTRIRFLSWLCFLCDLKEVEHQQQTLRLPPELRQVRGVLWRSRPWSCSHTQPGRQQLHLYRHGDTTSHGSLLTSCSGSPPTLKHRMGTSNF